MKWIELTAESGESALISIEQISFVIPANKSDHPARAVIVCGDRRLGVLEEMPQIKGRLIDAD